VQEIASITGPETDRLAAAVDGLLAQEPSAERLLLVIDQFEEVFSQADRAEQASFVTYLKKLRALPNVTLLITVRADFYADLMNTEFWPEPSQRIDILPLRGDKLRQAIERPARDMGVFMEAGLVERLLADAADEPGVLPLLQETLVLLWMSMARRYLPLSAYEQMGSGGRSGLAVAIANKANAAFDDLDAAQRAIARRIFLRLVQFGEGRADTRRQQRVDELTDAGEPAEFKATLDHLVRNRLLTQSEGLAAPGEKEAAARVDLSHEKLITGWPIFQQWITERREGEKTRRRLEGDAREWVRLGRGDGALLDRVELADANKWLNSPDAADLRCSADLLDLVKHSREAIERAEREKEADRQRELEQARTLAEERRKRLAEAEYRLLQAELSDLKASVERSVVRAERNRLRAVREQLMGRRSEYVEMLNRRAEEFDRQAESLWRQVGELEKKLRGLEVEEPVAAPPALPPAAHFVLEILPSPLGAGLLVRYGDAGGRRLAVLKGGPRRTLLPRLQQLVTEPDRACPLPIELAVISHFDMDDVEGVLEVLKHLAEKTDPGAPRLAQIKMLWFNHFFHLFGSASMSLAKNQVVDIARALQVGLNEPFDYFVMPSEQGPAKVTLDGGLDVTVVAPDAKAFKDLYRMFERNARRRSADQDVADTLAEIELGVSALSEGFSSPRIDLIRAPAALTIIQPPAGGADASTSNLASIVMLVEYGGRKLLFCSDSRCDYIVKGLSQAGYLEGDQPLHVDVLVVPHWGSRRNVSVAFFQKVTASHYVIGENQRFRSPDLETLQMIGQARAGAPYTIHMADPAGMPWLAGSSNKPGFSDPHAWKAHVAAWGEGPVMIDLLAG
jgi:hypothetical protein